jgi:hypothetical protein
VSGVRPALGGAEEAEVKGMRPPYSCRIGKATVPLRDGNWPTLAVFRAGEHGTGEAGHYHFWTAVLMSPVKVKDRVRKLVIGRSQALHDPGERFERIGKEAKLYESTEDREHCRVTWLEVLESGLNVAYVRPSTLAEVRRWIATHPADARHITRLVVRGKDAKP